VGREFHPVLPSINPESPNGSFKLQWISRDRNHSLPHEGGIHRPLFGKLHDKIRFGGSTVSIGSVHNGRMFRFLSELQVVVGG
jgi:hypothetical protein